MKTLSLLLFHNSRKHTYTRRGQNVICEGEVCRRLNVKKAPRIIRIAILPRQRRGFKIVVERRFGSIFLYDTSGWRHIFPLAKRILMDLFEPLEMTGSRRLSVIIKRAYRPRV